MIPSRDNSVALYLIAIANNPSFGSYRDTDYSVHISLKGTKQILNAELTQTACMWNFQKNCLSKSSL